MPTVEERLASLEARSESMNDVKNTIADLRVDVNRQFAATREDMNVRFAEINGRFGDLNGRFGDLNNRFADMNGRFDEVNRRLAALDEKGDRHFTWLVTTQVALLLAVVGALVGAYYR